MNNSLSTLEESIKKKLDNNKFEELFIELLGWDSPQSFQNNINTNEYPEINSCKLLVQKRGVCLWVIDGLAASKEAKSKLVSQIRKISPEYFLLYFDKTNQIWEFPNNGKFIRYKYKQGFHNDSFIQRLIGVKFKLSEESNLTIVEVSRRLNANFNTDQVSKSFYTGYMKLYKKVKNEIEPQTPEEVVIEQLASKIMTSFLFVYFLQKKRFLDDNINYLEHKFNLLDKSKNFFSDFYVPLCLINLKNLKNIYDSNFDVENHNNFAGTIPHVGGSQFDFIYDNRPLCIKIENNTINELLNFLSSYRWHLDEAPSLNNNEINPEILGYILQQYVTGVESGKESGAFYTKNDITDYITSKSLGIKLIKLMDPDLNYTSKIFKESPSSVYINSEMSVGFENHETLKDIDKLLPGETEAQNYKRKILFNKLKHILDTQKVTFEMLSNYPLKIDLLCHDIIYKLSKDELDSFKNSLRKIKILDPTCGSGAFLFSALKLLESINFTIYTIEKGIDEIMDYPDNDEAIEYKILKSIMVNNLYGVDFMPEAIEVARLRMYLTLIAKLDRPDQIEQIPDLEFNIKVGNLLVGFTKYEHLKEEINKSIENQEIFQINYGERIEKAFPYLIKKLKKLKELQNESIENNSLEINQLIHGSRPKRKSKDLVVDFNKLSIKNLSDLVLLDGKSIYHKKYAENYYFKEWTVSHKPFNWHLEFPELFELQGESGFDVIIGNPPYVSKTQIESYEFYDELTSSCPDIFATCSARSIQLLKKDGVMGFIVPLSMSYSSKYEELRTYIQEQFKFINYATFDKDPAALFNGTSGKIKTRNTLFLINNFSKGIFATDHNRWRSPYREALFKCLVYYKIEKTFENKWAKLGDENVYRILNKFSGNYKNDTLSSLIDESSNFNLFYKKTATYWLPILPEWYSVYEVDQNNRVKLREEKDKKIHPISFKSEDDKFAALALLVSKFGYIWWCMFSDDFDVTKKELVNFPLINNYKKNKDLLSEAGKKLLDYLYKNPQHQIWRKNITYTSNISWLDEELKEFVDREINDLIFNIIQLTPDEIDELNNLYERLNLRQGSVSILRGKIPIE